MGSPGRHLSRIRTARLMAAALFVTAGVAAGCTTALGISDYTFHATEPGSSDGSATSRSDQAAPPADAPSGHPEAGEPLADASRAHAEAGGPLAEADAETCDVDLTVQCYPCAPSSQAQFLNACTSAACVPFDATRLTLLLPDGGLPPLPTPAVDGGVL
jgi:hypothetical protein